MTMLRFSTAAYPPAARSFMSRPIMSCEAQFARATASGSIAKYGLQEALFRRHGSRYAMYWSSDDGHALLERLLSRDPNVRFGEGWTADKGRADDSSTAMTGGFGAQVRRSRLFGSHAQCCRPSVEPLDRAQPANAVAVASQSARRCADRHVGG